MDPSQFKLTDWGRIFIGEFPPTIYIELLIRTVVIFVLLMTSMRLIGQRMASQLNRTELAAVVSLAAAAGVPLLSPDRGLLVGIVVAAVVVVIARFVAKLATQHAAVEKLTQGYLATLVEDGAMNLAAMGSSRITRERVCAELRSQSIHQLGVVKRLYIEANGAFSLLRNSPPKPGLLIVPASDNTFLPAERQHRDQFICGFCGRAAPKGERSDCPACGKNDWVHPVE